MSKQVDKNANLLSSLQSASPERVDAVSHTISQRLSDLEYQVRMILIFTSSRQKWLHRYLQYFALLVFLLGLYSCWFYWLRRI